MDALADAVIATAATFADITLHGRCKGSWPLGFLELPGRLPLHNTFRRVWMLIAS